VFSGRSGSLHLSAWLSLEFGTTILFPQFAISDPMIDQILDLRLRHRTKFSVTEEQFCQVQQFLARENQITVTVNYGAVE
jgi:hypothetical protein